MIYQHTFRTTTRQSFLVLYATDTKMKPEFLKVNAGDQNKEAVQCVSIIFSQ